MAGAMIGVFNCLDADVPHNAGIFRRLAVLLREGCVVGVPPSRTRARWRPRTSLNRLINPTQTAFAQLGDGHGLPRAGAAGRRLRASSRATTRGATAPYVNQLLLGDDGGPGAPTADGWITYAMPDCAKAIYIDSIEVLEQKYPLRFRGLRLLTDSGGPGRHRGAPASETVYGPTHASMQVFYFADFADHPPLGAVGGGAGGAALLSKLELDGSETALDPIGDVTLEPGEFVRGLEAGGGGYGDPLTRTLDAVAADVRDGWVSVEAARDHYGVVIARGPAPGEVEIDHAATEALRVEKANERGGP